MTNEQALQVLNGDFYGIEIPEGKTYSDLYAEAFEIAKEALMSEESREDRIKMWQARRIRDYCMNKIECEECTFSTKGIGTGCAICDHPINWKV